MPQILSLQRLVLAIATCAVIALASTNALADVVVFTTAPGAQSNGGSVSASATFSVGAGGVLTITLKNLTNNPGNVGQNLSDLAFSVSGLTGGQTGTLNSSNGNTVTVNANGTTTAGSNGTTFWELDDSTGPSFHLNGLGTNAPNSSYTIIGAPGPGGVYTNANSSIAGNDPHNPFVDQIATFTLTIPGLTSAVTQISGVSFSWGTTAGDNTPGTPNPVPEPTSMLLLGTGLLGVAGLARRRFKK